MKKNRYTTHKKRIHPTSNCRIYNAFTLAEVLITLGVIGVVAAMTMPTLIGKTQDKILETQYAKCRNIVENGYKLMMAHYDTFKVEDLPFLKGCDEASDISCISKEHKEIFNIVSDNAGNMDSTILPREYAIQNETEKSPFSWDDVPYIFATNDGMTYGILPDEDLTSFSVVADINGTKNPNTVKKDLYKFRYSGAGKLSDVSSELEELPSGNCEIYNTSGCRNYESCNSLNGYVNDYGQIYGASWDGSHCRIFITGNTGGGNSGDHYGWY